MQRTTLNLILGILVLTPAVLSEIGVQLNYDEDLKSEFSKRFKNSVSFEIQCTVTGSEGIEVAWHKNEVPLKPSERITMSNSGNVYKVNVKHAVEDDAGSYECIVTRDDDELKRANITMISKVFVKTPANLNFVEGEAIKITCQVVGRPTPTISWMVGNETYEESRDRVELEKDPDNNIENTVLIIKEAQMSDRKEYKCMAVSKHSEPVEAITFVRIKDKYAALWPFLGICAEVFVLCAIILIYEKKRNKSELEESDTDQSPDQKNTPDHGKDSNLRHRQ